jgi:CubicO group peptidase (beta-lactamase class C family)
VFEIGSITKVFTASLLADMVAKGEVRLDDPVAKYLPTSVRVPSHNGKQITLIDLATQSSGLPRMPNNFTPANSGILRRLHRRAALRVSLRLRADARHRLTVRI